MISRHALALAAGSLMLAGAAFAQDKFPLEGIYMQTRPCKGDKTDVEALRVRITDRQINFAGGICSIDERRQEDKTVWLRVTCKFKSGAVLSDNISFTMKDENTFDVAQKDGSYRAVISRCPITTAR
jgi:hypothetical protein